MGGGVERGTAFEQGLGCAGKSSGAEGAAFWEEPVILGM